MTTMSFADMGLAVPFIPAGFVERVIHDSIGARPHRVHAVVRRPVELDQSRVGRLSRMDALRDQAMAVESERRRGVEIVRIDAALARIEGGEYGFCLVCEDDIGVKRLEFDPATPLCITCARGPG